MISDNFVLVRYVIFLCAVATLIVGVIGELVHHEPCEVENPKCVIHEVKVSPCPTEPCKLKRGKPATLSVDYTPQFDAEKFDAQAYWANGFMDLPFVGMETNACLATPCPAKNGTKINYSVEIPIRKSYPLGTYNVKWKIYNEEHPDDCCFMFKLKVAK